MSSEPTLPPEALKEAVLEEIARFEQFYTWLEKSMPRIFFKEISKEWIALIVHSLIGFKEQNFFSQIHLNNAAISLCVDSPEADVKILKNFPLYGIKNYITYISREPLPFPGLPVYLRVASIHFTEAVERPAPPLPQEVKKELIDSLKGHHPDWAEKRVEELISQMDPRFLRTMSIGSQVIALEMFERARERDRCQYEVQYEEKWQEKNLPSMFLVLAWKNVPKHNFLYRFARVVCQHGLVMSRINASYVNPYKVDSVFVLSLRLHGAKGEPAWEAADIADFLQEIVTLKYFGSMDTIDQTFVQTKLLRGNLANFLRTSVQFINQVLVNVDQNLYSIENVEEGLCHHPELTLKLCEAFESKFHPLKHDLIKFESIRDDFLKMISQLDTGHEYHDLRRKNILLQGMNFITHTLKTNFYRNNKTTLSFRLDPHYLDHAPFDRKNLFPELPFGIFFIKGMHFFSFHIRFKDLARGGLRTVFPERKERMLAERNSVFTECYNLSLTQQKKNKDIPEGGAKAVIFLKPYERLESEAQILEREMHDANMPEEEIKLQIEQFKKEQKLEYLYQTQRSFIKGLLILTNCENDGALRAKHIIDYWQKPEYIYLGPDENMHNSMIEWIASTSKKERYRPGGAFISGKRIGINHKEYGVTSLGVNVYMTELLRFMGIDPSKDPFTVKMTGGPDGDVAGNQIMNLYRYYPDTAKLVALTDVSGTIYDPFGLDLKTCATLFQEEKSIRFYPSEKLNVGGFLLDKESRREPAPYVHQTLCWRNKDGTVEADWISGNEMNALYRYNVHQTKADIFIPCGGRPRTLRDTNYKDFLDKGGEPTAKAIVEGANLYLSPWARHYLEEKGVLIIKDSSANKGGVICSSFEILCSLTLSDEEFLEHKEELVKEILLRLKACSLDEAHLLLSSFQSTKKPLTELSDEISKKINYFTDQLLDYLEKVKLAEHHKDPLIQCFLNYCPKLLRENFQDRLLKAIPENHKKAIIASHIAAKLVYKRGLQWFPTLVETLPLILQDKELIGPL